MNRLQVATRPPRADGRSSARSGVRATAAVAVTLTLLLSGCFGAFFNEPGTLVMEVASLADSDAPGINGSDMGDFSQLRVHVSKVSLKPNDNTQIKWFTVNRTIDLVEVAADGPVELTTQKMNFTKSYSRFVIRVDVERAVLRNGTSVDVSHLRSYTVEYAGDDAVRIPAGNGERTTYRFVLVPLYNDEDIRGPDGEYFLMLPQWRSGPVTS